MSTTLIAKEQGKIGNFIRELRELRGLTQEDFAELIGTSQSAVARMEKGEQNFTTEILTRVSKALNHKIVSLAEGSIDFEIEGGRKLSGEITTNASKNGAMGLLCASLLNKGTTTLHNIPRIEEVNRMLEVLTSIGVQIKWTAKNTLEITPPAKLALDKINTNAAIKTRSVIMLMGPLIHLFNKFSLPHASGCKLGKRTVSAHLFGLEEMGVKIKVTRDSYDVSINKLRGTTLVMYEAGDTAAENLIIAAAKIPGKTVIKFAPANYMVQETCRFLQTLGVKVEGVGTSTVTIEGIKEIDQDVEYWNSEDPIEAMMFLSAAITTGSHLMIKRCPIDFLELELYKLKKMGLKFKRSKEYFSQNGFTKLVDLEVLPSTLQAAEEKIHAQPYPGINQDNLPFFVPIAAQAKGTTLIHDWTFENRAIYFMELAKLGAQMILADPHRVFIEGPTPFKPTQLVCPPALRPAMIILIAMLAAPGKSILRNVYSINRGYEEIAERLNKLGAKIRVIREM
ncbi:MAG: UDP-N-acetylglucosamine 1-carboxyvinyltransferase [Candidatus Abawacabacteria bacterium]|nr:UDP-N-acetylglucosamine 1-carboxyvinyltransferase [Candidatus Abawacabacteria bacterium]